MVTVGWPTEQNVMDEKQVVMTRSAQRGLRGLLQPWQDSKATRASRARSNQNTEASRTCECTRA